MRRRAQEFEDNPELVRGIVAEGAEKAREAARQTLDEVRRAMHLRATDGGEESMKPDLKIVVSNAAAPAVAALPPPEQAEMPFAMVNGEPISQLPRDLYIPPQALEVFLEAFEGPLDLLLVPDQAPEPRHPRHSAGGDHAPVHAVHRADAGPAARAGR